jgi:hypothetical protein
MHNIDKVIDKRLKALNDIGGITWLYMTFHTDCFEFMVYRLRVVSCYVLLLMFSTLRSRRYVLSQMFLTLTVNNKINISII